MNRDSMLELRVLSGTHSGARALLAAQSQIIGSDESCALILSDDGVLAQHARLEHRADGSTVLRWIGSELPALVIRPGQGAQVGPVRVAVDRADAPWRDDVPLAEPFSPRGDLPDGSGSTPVLESAGRPALRRAVALRAIGFTVALGLAGLALWPMVHALQRRQAAAVDAAHPAARPHPGAQSNDRLQAGIAQLGLTGRVRIDRTDPQRPVVTAGFLPEDDLLALAQYLSALSPRPRLVSVDEAELVASVTRAVQAPDPAGVAGLGVQYLGAGRFRVVGSVEDEDERVRALNWIEKSFPLAAGFESALSTRAESAAAMLEELRREVPGQVSGAWTDGTLVLDVKLPPGGLPRWERAVVQAASRHALPWRANVRIEAGASAAQMARAPFAVRSVAFGPLPNVTLTDGRKLVTGARVDGWVLQEIHPRALVFADPRGIRTTMEP